jgi:undecaprenyl-diphosphatase
MDTLHALALAALQGATELFPVSSLGHAVLAPALLGWRVDERAFLPFLVLLHLGTAAALLGYFWRDWVAILGGSLGAGDPHRVREARHILALLVVATIPAVVLGGALEHAIRRLFASPLVAAGFLIANGALLLWGERLRRTPPAPRAIATLSVRDALVIGLWQCLALLPGISRSGATIVGGLLRGIDHAGAARFSFLIATPIILGATALEVPKLLRERLAPGTIETAALAAVVAGLVALASTAALMRWFREHDEWALDPFAWYCIAAGVLAGGVLMWGAA